MQLLGLYAATKVKVAIENFHATFTIQLHCSVDYPYRNNMAQEFHSNQRIPVTWEQKICLNYLQNSSIKSIST